MSAQVIERIDRKLAELDPASVRYQILVELRKFRSSWVGLGRLLTDIAYGGDYKGWDHDDFEVYCARELGLKKPTVKKLMVSFNYMKSYAPERLENADESAGYDVPDYQTVELLKKARDREDIPEEEKEELHRLAFDAQTECGVLRKEIRTRLAAGVGGGDVDEIDQSNTDRRALLQKLLKQGRTVRQTIAAAKFVPESVRDRVDQALLELEALD